MTGSTSSHPRGRNIQTRVVANRHTQGSTPGQRAPNLLQPLPSQSTHEPDDARRHDLRAESHDGRARVTPVEPPPPPTPPTQDKLDSLRDEGGGTEAAALFEQMMEDGLSTARAQAGAVEGPGGFVTLPLEYRPNRRMVLSHVQTLKRWVPLAGLPCAHVGPMQQGC